MAESKSKLTEEELTQVNSMLKSEQRQVAQLGSVTYRLEESKKIEAELYQQQEELINSINELRKVTKGLIDSLTEKYGDGELNIDTGEFTSTK